MWENGGHAKTGQYLYSCLESHPQFEIAFVWNRSKHVLIDRHVAPSLILDKLENIFELEVDLIVEVAHPSITKKVRQIQLASRGICFQFSFLLIKIFDRKHVYM